MGRNRMAESMGEIGSVAITGTGAVTPPSGYYFFAVQVTTDMVVSAKTDLTQPNTATNADVTTLANIPAGTVYFIKVTSITLSSGEGIGYLAKIQTS